MSFPDLPLHPAVASALAARGYSTATPVQAAVLEAAHNGRDLLVSAPTGSGKTVAFGSLIAQTLLADPAPAADATPADPDAPAPITIPRGAPRALVVAPTRELANQVAQELTWLFAKAKLSIGAFTGGTAVPNDLRRLRAGVDVVVGTPGRLVDMHERGALVLAGIQALVLDEADEMLDLGFREALEHLLGAAPKQRRTLLFSATLPPEISRMAATYQRDAIRVDGRAKGAGAAHADIQYLAHLVRPQERLAAVVNVLLGMGNGKAIVFCRTREGVGELHQRLVDHGFRAAAISGDRAQGDRDRALGSLRSGRARVLVATNVAARGLDLPDVELVLHADLPENGEALTHRSGRTGRAGRKGKSVVIADMRERRKAERLLQAARTPVRWTPAPTAADVRRALIDGLRTELIEAVQGHLPNEGDDEAAATSAEGADDGTAKTAKAAPTKAAAPVLDPEETAALADRLRAALPDRVLIAELLGRELGRLPAPMNLNPLDAMERPDSPRLAASARLRGGRDDGDMSRGPGPGWTDAVVFRVNLGAAAKAEPGWLLPLICRRGGVTRREVGAIRVGPQWSTFEISAAAAPDFALAAAETDPRAPHVVMEPLSAAGGPRPDRAPAADRPRFDRGPDRGPDRPMHPARPVAAPRPPRPAPARARAEAAPPASETEAASLPAEAPAAVIKPVPALKPVAAPAPVRSQPDETTAVIDELVARHEHGDEAVAPAAAAPVEAPRPKAQAKAKLKDAAPAAVSADDEAPPAASKGPARPAPYFASFTPEAASAAPAAKARPAALTSAEHKARTNAAAAGMRIDRSVRAPHAAAEPRGPRFGSRAEGAGHGANGAADGARPGPRVDRGPRFGAGAPPAGRGPRFGADRPQRLERPGAPPRFGAGAARPTGHAPDRGPRFGTERPGPAPRGPSFGAGFAPGRGGAPSADRGPRFGGSRLDGGGPRTAARPGAFSPRPGAPARPSANTDDRPRRGRPRSPS